MDKFSQLLSESTIVDFRLLWKLALRHSSHFIIAIIFFCAVFLINYYKQPVVYAVSVPVKAISNHVVSQDLTALLPIDNAGVVNLVELKISMENFAFLRSYAELTLLDPQFDQLNFGSISAVKNLYGRELKKNCGKDKECLTERLVNSLVGSFSIEQGLTENRFTLIVNAIEKNTVKRLTSVLLKALEINRVHVRQYLVLKEIQSVGSLIAESRSVMQKMDGYKALEDQEKLQNNINDLKERIRMLQFSSSTELSNVTALEARLIENKKSTINKGLNHQDKFEKIQKAQTRLVEVKQNISILSNIPGEKRSGADNAIIAQLKKEQSILLSFLPVESQRKAMELSTNFAESQRGKFDDFEFDYLVAKNKLDKLNSDYESSKTKLNEMFQQKIVNENKVIGMKTDLDFLKNLESKQMSLKLLNATMTSDLFFEDIGPVANEFRQSTYLQIFFFSFSLTSFLYIISILIRYFLDDKIYGEEDIRIHLTGLDFVGEVPLFE